MGDKYPNTLHLEAHFHRSLLKRSELNKLVKAFEIQDPPYRVRLPNSADRACNWTGELCVYKEMLEAGFRFPPHPFVCQILAEVSVSPSQLHPNAWKIIHVFLAQCLKKNIEPSVAVFRRIFHFKNSTAGKHGGWVLLQHRHNVKHIFKTTSMPDSLPNWKDEFFFVEWIDHEWSSIFRTSFGTVVDGKAREVKLNTDETEAVNKLCEDNGQTHYLHILWEDNLQALGLSTLGPEAKGLLKAMLHKKKDNADNPPEMEPKKALRRKRGDEEVGPTIFRHSKPLPTLDESVFVSNWSIRNCDSVVGSLKLSEEWSHKSITPLDRQQIVVGSSSSIVKSMGCQALATANAYFQSAFHHLSEAERRVDTEERKVKQLEEDVRTWKKRFERVEMEHAGAVQTVEKLESALKKALGVDEFLASPACNAYVEGKYEKKPPNTYTDCWEQIIKLIRKQHPDYDLSDVVCPFTRTIDQPATSAATPRAGSPLQITRCNDHMTDVDRLIGYKHPDEGGNENEEETVGDDKEEEVAGNEDLQ